jgi:NAD(P)-dependent dehydrogenase (short-subunit alcohol dehydrogenase family)
LHVKTAAIGGENTMNSAQRNVLITGALSGIGRATALAFARDGAHVVVSGRDEQKGKDLVDELAAVGTEAAFVRTDVRNDKEVKALVERAVARFGPLDVGVNNAGTEGTPGSVVDQTDEDYAATFATNVLGTLLSMKYELRAMLPRRSGVIVNLSSCYGHEGAAGASVYVASKHAVEGLTKSAALEVAESGVRVNAVAPGPIETPMLDRFTGDASGKARMTATVPSKRAGKPEEIAQVILFLASPAASYMTGAIVPVDGGMSAV